MTREEAASIIKDMAKRCIDAGEMSYDQIVDACAIAVAALRGPQPDRIDNPPGFDSVRETQ